MPRTKIFLLGSPRVERDGEAVEADTRKATALVAYLAVGGSPARRDTVVDLLWPEYGQKKGRAALRRTLSALGRARSEGWLVVDRENISLDLRDAFVDVNHFRNLLEQRKNHGHPDSEVCAKCAEALSDAAEIYRGDFMAGFGLRDSAVFDDWQFFHGEELRRELSAALEKLSRAEAAKGNFESAVSHARRRLDLDRLDEESHRKLMELYALSGQRTAALRQFEECSKTLERELGIQPTDETTRLFAAIKTNAADSLPKQPELAEYHPDSTDEEVSVVPVVREYSLPGASIEKGAAMVGRDAEWEKLVRAYEGARSGGRFVVLEGEAGVGKTRLAEEFSRRAAGEGAATVVVRCHPDEAGLAYGPFAEALSVVASGGMHRERLGSLPEHHLGEAARLAPALASTPASGSSGEVVSESPGAQSRFFEGVAQTFVAVLEGSEGGSPGVLFVDDVHWADGASLEFLSYLVRRIGDRRVCVVCAWRGDLVGEGHPLRRLLSFSNRTRMSAWIPIPRLDRDSVESLVEAAVGDVPELGERIYEETEGLPLLVSEYLAAMENGEISARDESWPLPGGVRDLLRERLGALGLAERRMLGAAAVIGHSFDLDTLRDSSGGGDEEEAEISALEDLATRGLIEEVDDGNISLSYDFAHEKLRSLVYEETSLARRRLLHRRVAESLARRSKGGTSAARIARHYEMAGMASEAAGYFETAGEAHRSLYANSEALSNFRSALALGHPDEAGIYESIGDILTLAGEYEGAIRSFESSKVGRRGNGLARVERKLGGLRHRRGESEISEGHYRAALGILEEIGAGGNAGERARLFSEMSLLARSRGNMVEAGELSGAALELAGESDDPLSLARTQNVAAIVSRSGGDLHQARSHLEHSLELSAKLEDPGIRIAALNNLALVLGESGDDGSALDITREALELCVASGDRHHEAALRNNLADLLHKMGREEEAMAALKEAVGIFAEIGGEGDWQPEIWKLVEW